MSALNRVKEWAVKPRFSIACEPKDRFEMLAIWYLRQGSLEVSQAAAAPIEAVENRMVWLRHPDGPR